MVAPADAHFGLELTPLQAPLATDVGEGFLDPGLHTFQAADVDMGVWIIEQPGDDRYWPLVRWHLDPASDLEAR